LYNHDHRRSGIRYVSPAQRHAGEDRDILARRHALYLSAREANPRRWARHTRNWNPIAAVTLNPEKETVVNSALLAQKERKKRLRPHDSSGNYVDTHRRCSSTSCRRNSFG
jgi:putative transposase